MKSLYDLYPAFFRWFAREFRRDHESGARYLLDCCRSPGSGSVVWAILKATGDGVYTRETFLKAAKLCIEVGETAEKLEEV